MDPTGPHVLPLAVRFVPYDQWLVTHISTKWKTRQVKQHILSKCLPISSYARSQAPDPPKPRSLSPITFASVSASKSRRSFDRVSAVASEQGDGDREEGDDDGDGFGLGFGKVEPFDNEDADETVHTFPIEHGKHSSSRHNHYYSTSVTAPKPSASHSDLHGSGSTRICSSDGLPCYHQAHFSLLTFSTSHLLEDDYTVSWYRLRPYELLEMHIAGAIVRFQRDSPTRYIEPYFLCQVKALRMVWKEVRHEPEKEKEKDRDRDKESGRKKKDKDKETTSRSRDTKSQQTSSSSSSKLHKNRDTLSDPSVSMPIRKTKMEWRDRWIVIRHGVLKLCKDRNDTSISQTFPLASLRILRGAEHLVNSASGSSSTTRPNPHIICAKFKHPTPSHAYSHSSLSGTSQAHGATPSAHAGFAMTGLYKDEYGRRGSAPGLLDPGGVEPEPAGSSSRPGTGGIQEETEKEVREDEHGTGGVWLVLDMLDESAHTSLLRIFHRHASPSVTSSFLPSATPSRPSSRSHHRGPQLTSLSIPSMSVSLPYPEWRIHLVDRARRVGMGDVGPVLEWVLLGEDTSQSVGSIDKDVPLSERKSQESWRGSGSWSVDGSNGRGEEEIETGENDEVEEDGYDTQPDRADDSDDDDDDEEQESSEKEWDGWMRDLERQKRVRKAQAQAHKERLFSQLQFRKVAHDGVNESQILEAVRIPDSNLGLTPISSTSLSTASTSSPRYISSATTSVYSAGPSSFASGAHAGVGGVFAPGIRPSMIVGRPGTTTSTVSVGGRVRSTTVSAGNSSKTSKDKGKGSTKQKKGQALKLSLPFPGFSSGKSAQDRGAVRWEFAPATEKVPDEDSTCKPDLRQATSMESLRARASEWDIAATSRNAASALSSPVEGSHARGNSNVGSAGKKKSGPFALVRGMSVRGGAEKLVRGLDSALDFVEGK